MSRRRRSRRPARELIASELELMPLMNLFIVIIPMLLLSAVFLEIRVMDMTLPSASDSTPRPSDPPLALAIRIVARAYIVEGNGIPATSIPRPPRGAGLEDADEAAQARLAAALAPIVAAHPENREVRIIAEPTTRYEEIIHVMDVARAAGLPQAALEGATSGGV